MHTPGSLNAVCVRKNWRAPLSWFYLCRCLTHLSTLIQKPEKYMKHCFWFVKSEMQAFWTYLMGVQPESLLQLGLVSWSDFSVQSLCPVSLSGLSVRSLGPVSLSGRAVRSLSRSGLLGQYDPEMTEEKPTKHHITWMQTNAFIVVTAF